MNPTNAEPHSFHINALALNVGTIYFLDSKNIQSQFEKISKTEQTRILNAGAGITVTNPPACVAPFRYWRGGGQISNIIALDKQFCNKFASEEIFCTILHEIGHIVNTVPITRYSDSKIEEYYADDYIRHCGFSTEWSTLLLRLHDEKAIGFDKPEIKERAMRFINNEPKLINEEALN